jgi:S1-C subfamily serine protease
MIACVCLLLVPAELPTIPSRDIPEATQRRAVEATVKVMVATGYASGAIVGREGQFVYVLTARHVVKRAKTVEIHVFTAASHPRAAKVYTGTVLGTAPSADLALVRLTTTDPLPEPLTICPPAALPKDKNVAAFSAGCAPTEAPTPAAEVLRARKLIRREGDDERSWCWEVESKQDAGRSGGPLLDSAGRLIGIATGHNAQHGYYVHVEEVYPFLKGNGFRSLYEK